MKVLILLFTFGGNGFSSVETQYVPSMKACEVVGKVFTDKLKTDWKSGSFECVVLPNDKRKKIKQKLNACL